MLNSRTVPRELELRIFKTLVNVKKIYSVIQTGTYMFKSATEIPEQD